MAAVTIGRGLGDWPPSASLGARMMLSFSVLTHEVLRWAVTAKGFPRTPFAGVASSFKTMRRSCLIMPQGSWPKRDSSWPVLRALGILDIRRCHIPLVHLLRYFLGIASLEKGEGGSVIW